MSGFRFVRSLSIIDSVGLIINIGQRMVNIAVVIAVGHRSGKPDKIAEITDYRAFSTDRFLDCRMRLLTEMLVIL
ncbi:MAG: hypothetical protein V2I56_22370 [Desulfobacteraceae bacterium]|jgi:hypothetical protein|nr:hypothetical protein [Desulfobacteraceae bacterium]